MISYVVIGRDEGHVLDKCLRSILNFNKVNGNINFEIIYVDSSSSDNSVNIALSFSEVCVYLLNGEVNAAIARNEGAKHSKGDILFFVDGDMELVETFYPEVFDTTGNLLYNFVSGNFVNYYYNRAGELIDFRKYYTFCDDRYEVTTGGIFIVRRALWENVGGMRNKYRRSQDVDYGLRMTAAGFKLLRKPALICNHHTISYYDETRLWSDLFKMNQLYQKSLLYRDHLFNPAIFKFLGREISLFALVVSLCLTAFFGNFYFMLFFVLIVGIKSVYKSSSGVSSRALTRFLYYSLLDIMVLLGFVFFWPSSKRSYQVVKIR